MSVNKYYLLYDEEKLVGRYTAKEISELLDCSSAFPARYADNGLKYRKRYSFARAGKGESAEGAWCAEWEETRRLLTG